MSAARPIAAAVAMNLTGVVEHPESGADPLLVDVDGRPYLPVGTSGIVLGVELGDRIDALDADHVAPGVTIAHPDPAARHALTALSCVGNPVVVRTGAAAGQRGVVIGKRGEAGRVIVALPQHVLATLRPGDQLSVRAYGQGMPSPLPGVEVMNIDPAVLDHLLDGDVDGDGGDSGGGLGVRTVLPSKVCGNGVGRPSRAWDVDLSLPDDHATLARLRFGDLVAIDDFDARNNLGYRRGWRTVGTIVHGPSPVPGHGPGLLPLLSGPAELLRVRIDGDHRGITAERLFRGIAAAAGAEAETI